MYVCVYVCVCVRMTCMDKEIHWGQSIRSAMVSLPGASEDTSWAQVRTDSTLNVAAAVAAAPGDYLNVHYSRFPSTLRVHSDLLVVGPRGGSARPSLRSRTRALPPFSSSTARGWMMPLPWPGVEIRTPRFVIQETRL